MTQNDRDNSPRADSDTKKGKAKGRKSKDGGVSEKRRGGKDSPKKEDESDTGKLQPPSNDDFIEDLILFDPALDGAGIPDIASGDDDNLLSILVDKFRPSVLKCWDTTVETKQREIAEARLKARLEEQRLKRAKQERLVDGKSEDGTKEDEASGGDGGEAVREEEISDRGTEEDMEEETREDTDYHNVNTDEIVA